MRREAEIPDAVGPRKWHPGEVRCWFFAIERFRASDFVSLLSADERQRAERFAFDRDRSAFTICRGLLRTLLAIHAGSAPAALRFDLGPAGKPALAAGQGEGLHFNLSHSQGFGLIAISRAGSLGVDLEAIRHVPDVEALVASRFAPEERREFERLPPSSRLRAFFAGWTRKEAFIKATGEGFGRELASFAVRIDPEPGAARLLRLDGEPPAAARWRIADLDLGPGFAAALALADAQPVIRIHALESEHLTQPAQPPLFASGLERNG